MSWPRHQHNSSATAREADVAVSTAHVFLDTNVLLHYSLPDQIPWTELAGFEHVVLHVPPVVISELDKHKKAPRKWLRSRAAKAIKWLRTSWKSTGAIRNGVLLELDRGPLSLEFSAYGLDPDSPDDRLVATALAFRVSGPGRTVLLGTGDFGMELKAHQLDLDTLLLPDEFRLQPDDDPETVALRRENAELRRAVGPRPALELAFDNGEECCQVARPAFSPMTAEQIEAQLAEERDSRRGADDVTISIVDREGGEMVLDGLDERYLAALRSHLEGKAACERAEALVCRITFRLSNTGTAPAERIEVHFDLPDGVFLRQFAKLPRVPGDPRLGAVPRHTLADIVFNTEVKRKAELGSGFLEDPPTWRVPRLRHNESITIELCAQFTEPAPRGFTIHAQVHCDNLTEPSEVELHVKLGIGGSVL